MRCDKNLLLCWTCDINGKVSGPETNVVSSWFLGVCFVVFLQIVKIEKVVVNWKCIYN